MLMLIHKIVNIFAISQFKITKKANHFFLLTPFSFSPFFVFLFYLLFSSSSFVHQTKTPDKIHLLYI